MLRQLQPVRVLPNLRPLYFEGPYLYCSRFNKIFRTDDFGVSLEPVAQLDLNGTMNSVIRFSGLAQRVMRSQVYRMRVLSNGNMVFIFRKGIYTLVTGQTLARKTFPVKMGSRPTSLSAKPGGLVVFADYWSNEAREAINVFGSDDGGVNWRKVHTFPAGEMRHIHGISYDKWMDCFWIVSGDLGDECCLYRCTPDFSEVIPVLRGDQGKRFYSLLVLSDMLIMATDTPLEDNFICLFDKNRLTLEQIQSTQNSSFYSCMVNDRAFISTNAEPSERNDTLSSHLWMGLPDYSDCWEHLGAFSSDGWDRINYKIPGLPSGLFQYPRIFFPDGENDSRYLVCQKVGLRAMDAAMVVYDTSDW